MQPLLVTAFFRLPDARTDRGLLDYLGLFDVLAGSGLPILVFFDDTLVAERVRIARHENVTVVPCRLETTWTYQTLAEWPDLALPAEINVMKDTRFFLTLMNAKLDYLEQARRLRPEARHLAWIDFGIMHIVPGEQREAFLGKLRSLRPPEHCLYTPGCWDRPADLEALWTRISWRFCGGFLLGDVDSLGQMYRAYQEIFAAEARARRALTWETNIWALLEAHGQSFDWYLAGHNQTIVHVPRTPMSICLSMIVKNEAAIIERCLSSVAPVIDEWVICDTGSTDDTPKVIEAFFGARGIPGRIVHTTFQNFAQARNEALVAARAVSSSDYLLLTDADMEFQGTIDKGALGAPSYRLIQKDSAISYFNTRLVQRSLGARYIGVTHEYLDVPGSQPEEISTAWFLDHATGANRSNKAERDIRLLTEGLQTEPGNGRYLFYLANTYRDLGRHGEAIRRYKERIAVDGWDEEIWFSYYAIALCHLALDHDADFVLAAFEAYNRRPTRAEPLYRLARFFRERGKNEASAAMCDLGLKIPRPTGDLLFVEDAVYERGFQEELAIVGFYSPTHQQAGYTHCSRLTTASADHVRDLARRNFVWYSQSAAELFGAEILDISPIEHDTGYVPMNPSVYCGPNGRFGIVRTVNYTINEQGAYPTSDDSGIIKTRNLFVEFDEAWRVTRQMPICDRTQVPKTDFPVEGFEDCRLFHIEDQWLCSTTVRDRGTGRCEIAILSFEEQEITLDAVTMRLVRDMEPERDQKNWLPFSDGSGRFVYMTDPTTVIQVGQQTTVIAKSTAPFNLTDLRGGSQVIPMIFHKEPCWLYLAHGVVWIPHRVYLHNFVLLGSVFTVRAVSDPFYFKKRGIEFAAGLTQDGEKLVASFGVHDASAHLAIFDTQRVLEHLGRSRKP